METTEKKFTEKESFDVIIGMIQAAKTNLHDESFYFLLWGWLVFFASLTHFILLKNNVEFAPAVWLLMPLGGIITAVYSSRQKKNVKVKTYVDEFMKYVLIAFLVSLGVVLFSMQKLGLNTYPMVLLVYGLWLFISGGAIKFNPLLVGGIINWIFAIASFFVSFDVQLLFLALAVLLGYIIPGYLLKRKFSQHV